MTEPTLVQTVARFAADTRARGIGPGAKAAAETGPAWRALAWLWRFVAATLAATAATAPLVAHHFGEVAPLSGVGHRERT